MGFGSHPLYVLDCHGGLGPSRHVIGERLSLYQQMNWTVDYPILNILALVALGMLVIVSGGIAYLTTIEWRDRRRVDREKREAKRKRRKQ